MREYLERIGIDSSAGLGVDYATLCLLQRQHLLTVPYENLDIMNGLRISLEIDDLYEKIVKRRRGGYCFELNGLFAWLLRKMGFGVVEYMARYLRGEEDGKIPMRRHRVIKVSCRDGDFLCDVGVGAVIPLDPIEIIFAKVNVQGDERYKLEKEPFLGNVLYEWKRGKWCRIYGFTEEEQLGIDYVMPSFYCEMHPDSYFRKMSMVHIFCKGGRKVMAGREFKEFSAKGLSKVMIAGTDEIYKELLARHFGLVIE